TATDPAPLTMIETTIQFKPKSEWPAGMTLQKVIDNLNQKIQFPGLNNAWVMPIKTRIDMQTTGIQTPVGVKITGPDLHQIDRIGKQVEAVLQTVPGTQTAYADRTNGGRYIEITPDRIKAARFGLNIGEIQDVISSAVGGVEVTQTVEGLERFPVSIRYPRADRDSVSKLKDLPIVTPTGATVALGQIATVQVTDGPPMIRSEDSRPAGFVFVTTYLQRATERLKQVVPLTLAIIFVLLFLIFRHGGKASLIMVTLPFALVGGFWLLWALGFELSIAVAVGFIALAGVAAEFGVVMLIYLDHAIEDRRRAGRLNTRTDLRDAIMEGAVLRVRPKAMTVAVILAGLIPILVGHGTGSEVMSRIAAPMIGGMITAPLLSMLLLPAVYWLWQRRHLPAG
ncbi:MAG: CusA/CzcA family heavy metal efflux RND transporter, partial [Halothiobacillus sp. 14-55-98]